MTFKLNNSFACSCDSPYVDKYSKEVVVSSLIEFKNILVVDLGVSDFYILPCSEYPFWDVYSKQFGYVGKLKG